MAAQETVSLKLAGVLTDREKVWMAVRTLREFTLRELCLKAKIDRRKSVLRDYTRELIKGGFLEMEKQTRPGAFARYRLLRDTGAQAPRLKKDGTPLPPSGQLRMWRVMKILRTFSAPELADAASRPDAPVMESTAGTYCRWLEKGGYLRSQGDDVPRWRFVRDTGARAPQVLSVKQLYDPNMGEVVTGENIEDVMERNDA